MPNVLSRALGKTCCVMPMFCACFLSVCGHVASVDSRCVYGVQRNHGETTAGETNVHVAAQARRKYLGENEPLISVKSK